MLLSSSANNITTDYFSYGVIDSTGRKSLTSQAFLEVNSAISINAKNIWTVRESTSTTLTVQGIDTSDSPRVLQYNIDHAPVYGVSNLTADHLKVVYCGQANFFTSPNMTWNGQVIPGHVPFDHVFLTALTQDGASSMPTKQLIQVVNVNDPTSITIDGGQSFITHAFGGVTGKTADYSEITFQGIKVTDPDLGVDPVHVEISTSNQGRLTLNRTSLRLFSDYVDFSSLTLCNRLASWRCSGYAVDSTNMSFVTSPPILQQLLNGMTYISLIPDVTDSITIKISDGEVSINIRHLVFSIYLTVCILMFLIGRVIVPRQFTTQTR
ncbi:hypothetical protein EON65_00010 [archaeon]|nr:MAG: hypothetical protein EON65_00010 [archaeon]